MAATGRPGGRSTKEGEDRGRGRVRSSPRQLYGRRRREGRGVDLSLGFCRRLRVTAHLLCSIRLCHFCFDLVGSVFVQSVSQSYFSMAQPPVLSAAEFFAANINKRILCLRCTIITHATVAMPVHDVCMAVAEDGNLVPIAGAPPPDSSCLKAYGSQQAATKARKDRLEVIANQALANMLAGQVGGAGGVGGGAPGGGLGAAPGVPGAGAQHLFPAAGAGHAGAPPAPPGQAGAGAPGHGAGLAGAPAGGAQQAGAVGAGGGAAQGGGAAPPEGQLGPGGQGAGGVAAPLAAGGVPGLAEAGGGAVPPPHLAAQGQGGGPVQHIDPALLAAALGAAAPHGGAAGQAVGGAVPGHALGPAGALPVDEGPAQVLANTLEHLLRSLDNPLPGPPRPDAEDVREAFAGMLAFHLTSPRLASGAAVKGLARWARCSPPGALPVGSQFGAYVPLVPPFLPESRPASLLQLRAMMPDVLGELRARGGVHGAVAAQGGGAAVGLAAPAAQGFVPAPVGGVPPFGPAVAVPHMLQAPVPGIGALAPLAVGRRIERHPTIAEDPSGVRYLRLPGALGDITGFFPCDGQDKMMVKSAMAAFGAAFSRPSLLLCRLGAPWDAGMVSCKGFAEKVYGSIQFSKLPVQYAGAVSSGLGATLAEGAFPRQVTDLVSPGPGADSGSVTVTQLQEALENFVRLQVSVFGPGEMWTKDFISLVSRWRGEIERWGVDAFASAWASFHDNVFRVLAGHQLDMMRALPSHAGSMSLEFTQSAYSMPLPNVTEWWSSVSTAISAATTARQQVFGLTGGGSDGGIGGSSVARGFVVGRGVKRSAPLQQDVVLTVPQGQTCYKILRGEACSGNCGFPHPAGNVVSIEQARSFAQHCVQLQARPPRRGGKFVNASRVSFAGAGGSRADRGDDDNPGRGGGSGAPGGGTGGAGGGVSGAGGGAGGSSVGGPKAL